MIYKIALLKFKKFYMTAVFIKFKLCSKLLCSFNPVNLKSKLVVCEVGEGRGRSVLIQKEPNFAPLDGLSLNECPAIC